MTLANGKKQQAKILPAVFLPSVAFSNFNWSLVCLGRKVARRIKIIKPKRSIFKLSFGPGALQKVEPHHSPSATSKMADPLELKYTSYHIVQATLPKEGREKEFLALGWKNKT